MYICIYMYIYMYIYIQVVISDPRHTECSNHLEGRWA